MRADRRQILKTGIASAALSTLPSTIVRAGPRRPLRDLVIVLPGIMGSVLSRNGREVWALSGSALVEGLRTLGASIPALALEEDSSTAETLDDGIIPTRLLPDAHLIPGFWKIDGYSGLARALKDEFDIREGSNYFEFPYDWRRDNRAAARRLARQSRGWLKEWRKKSGNPDARLVLVAHSMGGLVSRYFLEVLGGWRDTRMLVTFGTPYRGSLNALNSLANGISKSIGPITLFDISPMLRSFTAVHQLLPIYPCYDPGDGELMRLDAVKTIPNVDMKRVRDAMAFHAEIRDASEANERDPKYLTGRYTIHPIVGVYQSTLQFGRRDGDGVKLGDRLAKHPEVAGDGTVPEVSATPIESDALTRQQRIVYVSELHGSLQNSAPMLDHLKRLLIEGAAGSTDFRGPTGKKISLKVQDVYPAKSPLKLKIGCEDPDATLVLVVSDTSSGRVVHRSPIDLAGQGDASDIEIPPLAEGLYRARVSASDGASVTDVFTTLNG